MKKIGNPKRINVYPANLTDNPYAVLLKNLYILCNHSLYFLIYSKSFYFFNAALSELGILFGPLIFCFFFTEASP